MRGPRALHRIIDEEAGELLHEAAEADGVHMHYGEEVEEFVRSNGAITKVRTTKGMEIDAECYAYGFGLAMNTELCEGSGIDTSKNGILCDDHLETNVKGIYAAGDVADFYDPILEIRYRMGTWNNAGAHGKVVALNMMGGSEKYHDVPEYSSLLFKGQTITQFGLGHRPAAGSRYRTEDRPREEVVSRALLLGGAVGRRLDAGQRQSRRQAQVRRSDQIQAAFPEARVAGDARLDRLIYGEPRTSRSMQAANSSTSPSVVAQCVIHRTSGSASSNV